MDLSFEINCFKKSAINLESIIHLRWRIIRPVTVSLSALTGKSWKSSVQSWAPILHSWEDWLPHVAASINSSLCESTGQSPHFIIFGVDKRLPYDLLTSPQPPVYDYEDYSKVQLKIFGNIHKQVKDKLLQSSTARSLKQHKRACPVSFEVGDSVIVQTPERHTKLDPKFKGPYQIVQDLGGHKFQIFDSDKGELTTVHSDRLKKTSAEAPAYVPLSDISPDSPLLPAASDDTPPQTTSHQYNLRPRL